MAVRGAIAKEELIHKLLEFFPGSAFIAAKKEFRIPMEENGSPLEIKLTMTAAKDFVLNQQSQKAEEVNEAPSRGAFAQTHSTEMSEEEKEQVRNMLRNLQEKGYNVGEIPSK